MSESATVALVAVAAVAVVFFVTKQQESKANMTIAQIRAQAARQPSGSGALSLQDGIAIVGTAVATYFGGPGAGAKAATTLSPQ